MKINIRNRKKYILMIIGLLILSTGCSKQVAQEKIQVIKPVKVMNLVNEDYAKEFNYITNISTDENYKLGFKITGRIDQIYVNRGDQITKGQKIASIEKTDYELALKASKSQYANGNVQVTKTKDILEHLQKTYNDSLELYESGAISKSTLDEVKLQLDNVKADYETANGLVEQAGVVVEINTRNLDETTLYSTSEGYVVDVLNEKGEIVDAGYPVVFIRNKGQIAIFGATQKDINKLKINDEATVVVDGVSDKGKIISLSEVPDIQTRTYEVKIELENAHYPIGAIGNVKIPYEKVKSIMIPLSSVTADVEDYVFVVEDGLCRKKVIDIIGYVDDSVFVSGLNENEILVIEGMNRLRDEMKVNIIE